MTLKIPALDEEDNYDKERIEMTSQVTILNEAPENIHGFEEMNGYAIDAYPNNNLGTPGAGNFSEEAKALAIITVSKHYQLTLKETLDQYKILIIPGPGFQGKIIAQKK